MILQPPYRSHICNYSCNFENSIFILMRKLIFALSLWLPVTLVQGQTVMPCQVNKHEIFSGYITEKVWLEHYAMPQVSIAGITYEQVDKIPDDAIPSSVIRPDVILGKERKRPFALVRIPAYTQKDGSLKQVAGFELTVKENKSIAGETKAAAKTTSDPSPLATGTWYKISVPSTGVYKIDYDFLTKAGINPSSFSAANIRVYGNGGRMLPENNAIDRPDNLMENAIWVNDGGDGTIGPGDYFLFYAIGPDTWTLDSTSGLFRHTKNIYEEKSYYFLNFDMGPGKRVGSQANVPTGANVTVNDFNDYVLYENELYNPGKIGKIWWGEEFSADPGKQLARSFELELGPVSEATFRISTGSRAAASGNSFSIQLNGQPVQNIAMPPSFRNEDDTPVSEGDVEWTTPYSNAKANFTLTYQPVISPAVGYLNYIEANTRRALYFNTANLNFRDWKSVGQGKIANYQLANAGGSTQVWDVTDPYNAVKMNGNLNGNTYSFVQDAEMLHEFTAVNTTTSLPVPEYIGTVANQNLHGYSQADYIIVTNPAFLTAAENVANFHRSNNGMNVVVATTDQVYNEFSSGSQDVSAIRDFAKMFYDRAGNDTTKMPRYLLLVGDASFDYRDRVPNNSNYVPTFESAESFYPINSFCNDDFFGFLDDNEYIENTKIANTLDLGVGRFPVVSNDEAMGIVNKIYHYKSPESLGPWRLSVTMIADDEDNAGPHMEDGEVMAATVAQNSNIYNPTKIYENVIPTISTPGGQRAPEANKAINDQVFKGTLLLNYNGHGNTQVLSHERILTQDDFNKWKNLDKLPFMITATCDFGRFDHPDYVSAGEKLVLKSDGGVIATLTTTQLVFQYANRILNQAFIDAQFKHENGKWNTFGDAFRIGKNKVYQYSTTTEDVIFNFRKFALLGDPALEPNFPQYFIHTNQILDGATGSPVDSIGALGEYIIQGSVTDVHGQLLDFNGNLSVTFFDKPRVIETTVYDGTKKSFEMRNNIIYKGKATVTNGKFSVAFIAPKDINYEYGKGKLSQYAENGTTDAAGADTSFTVGGFSKHPVIEYNPPVVKPYIGDSLFINGGLTGPNTLLFVILEDETGINVSGNSVGHDLTAVLDGDVANPYIMNDYYETAPNTYKRGYVSFPVTNLPEGRHRITVKAWDVNNNSGEGYVDFEVANGNIVKVQNLMNYPNPFSNVTHFRFEHNHPDEVLDAEINIYNTAGMLLKTLRQAFEPTGSHSDEITWDGTDDNGAKLPAGIYIYRMKIATATGIRTMAYQKLVIVR